MGRRRLLHVNVLPIARDGRPSTVEGSLESNAEPHRAASPADRTYAYTCRAGRLAAALELRGCVLRGCALRGCALRGCALRGCALRGGGRGGALARQDPPPTCPVVHCRCWHGPIGSWPSSGERCRGSARLLGQRARRCAAWALARVLRRVTPGAATGRQRLG
eukprot:COSAG02_NODE_2910_length_7766_cov_5.844659_6_plen_163_part_00